jgi:hypothetical protein
VVAADTSKMDNAFENFMALEVNMGVLAICIMIALATIILCGDIWK